MRANLLSPQDARVALPVSCWPDRSIHTRSTTSPE
jgi:hypothetical protein